MWSRLFSGAIFSTSSNSGHQPDHVAASSRTPKPPAGNRGGQSGLAAVLDGVWWSGPGLSPGETGDSVGDFLELGVGLLSS